MVTPCMELMNTLAPAINRGEVTVADAAGDVGAW
jgi:hypothetical protein